MLDARFVQQPAKYTSTIFYKQFTAQWLRASNIFRQIQLVGRGFESLNPYQSGFEFVKSPLLILRVAVVLVVR